MIVVGGGIAGLYTLYKHSQKYPDSRLLLLEKEALLGGRISTLVEKGIILEKGAGRFNDTHSLLIQLIHDLRLKHTIQKTSTDVVYMPNVDGQYKGKKESESLYDSMLKWVLGEDSELLKQFIVKVILASYMESKETLIRTSFIQYAQRILPEEQCRYIENSFGYYKELHDMNAYDCLQLLRVLNPANHNYIFRGGMMTLVDKLVERIQQQPRCQILTQKKVNHIQWDKTGGFTLSVSSQETYFCDKLVCALPREALISFPLFASIKKKWLDKVNSGSLCRIYSRFSKNADGRFWFQDLPKITTNNALRMMIPIDLKKGMIMISYTDGPFAESWHRLYQTRGVHVMNRKIRHLVKEITGIDIPKPIDTRVYYWKYGVGYWGIGADSQDISQKIIQPFPSMDLFVCGENYSGSFQQWVEGALETSEKVVDLL